MKHIRAIILVLAFLSNGVEAQPNFILNIISYLLSPLLDWLIRGACRAIFRNFDDGFRLGCQCRGVYEDLFGSLGGRIKCQIDDPFCLINRPFKVYCGEIDLTATFNTREGISNVKACIDITSDFPKNFPIPIDDVSQFPKACVSAVPSGMDFLTFESCEITFDKEPCKSCEVCDSKRDFLFDCSNVNINPAQGVEPTFIEGPVVTECIGFSFLFGSTTDPPTTPPTVLVLPIFAPISVPTTSPTNFTLPVTPIATPVTPPTNPVAAPVNTTVPVAAPVNAPVPVATPCQCNRSPCCSCQCYRSSCCPCQCYRSSCFTC